MSDPVARPERADAELNRHIAEAETHLKAINAELVEMIGTDADLSGVRRRFSVVMDVLMQLRRELYDRRTIERPE